MFIWQQTNNGVTASASMQSKGHRSSTILTLCECNWIVSKILCYLCSTSVGFNILRENQRSLWAYQQCSVVSVFLSSSTVEKIYSDVFKMENRAVTNGNGLQSKLTRCASSVGDSGTDKAKVGWTSPRDIWRNLSLRRKAEVNKTITIPII